MKNELKNFLKAVLILCVSIFIIYLLFKYQRYFRHVNIKALRTYILSFGPLAFLIFILMYSLKPIIVVFPALVLTVLSGNIFGPIIGFLLTMISLFFASTLAFYLSRSLGKPFVAKITRGKLLKLDDNIEVYGFKIIFLMRLSTLFPYDPLSYAAGLTKMRYSDFILGSLLGTAPEMLAYTYLGQSMRHPFSKRILIPIILIAVLALCGSLIYKYQRDKRKETA